MAKGKGGKAFGKSGGGGDGMKTGLITSPQSTKMVPKGGKLSGGKKGY